MRINIVLLRQVSNNYLNEFEHLFKMNSPTSLYQPAPIERQRGRK